VDHEGTTGFIPLKSLIKAKKFSSASKTAKVTETDMAAATKGFSPEVEKQNRKNRALRYDLMDQAEVNSSVDDPLNSLESFRQQGRLGEFQMETETETEKIKVNPSSEENSIFLP
jgi:hypothetical protein